MEENLKKVKEDLTGRVFGKLTVIGRAPDYIGKNGDITAKWWCECSCENHTIKAIGDYHLRHGDTLSCGCLVKDILKERNKNMSGENSPNKKHNTFRIEGDLCIGTDAQGREFITNAEFYDKIKDIYWAVNKKRYVNGKINEEISGGLHQFLTDFKYDMVDHINKNPSDNRIENLRPCNHQTNGFNRGLNCNNKTGVSGVFEEKSKENTWRAFIKINGKTQMLGTYHNFDDAVRARLLKEKELFGEFAPQKHLFEKYGVDNDD